MSIISSTMYFIIIMNRHRNIVILTQPPLNIATQRFPSVSMVIPSGNPGILFFLKSKTIFLFAIK